jgi:hypothetical protein
VVPGKVFLIQGPSFSISGSKEYGSGLKGAFLKVLEEMKSFFQKRKENIMASLTLINP